MSDRPLEEPFEPDVPIDVPGEPGDDEDEPEPDELPLGG